MFYQVLGSFFEFLKSYQSQFLKYFRIKEAPASSDHQFQFFSESKNGRVCLFQKPQTTGGFHERTSKGLMVLWPVLWLLFLRTVTKHQSRRLTEYLPGMITDRYLSLILRTRPTLVFYPPIKCWRRVCISFRPMRDLKPTISEGEGLYTYMKV